MSHLILVIYCVWFGFCEPAPPPEVHHSHDVAPVATVSTSPPGDTGMGNGTSDVAQWAGLVAAYFTDLDTALCIITYESGGNPNAVNPSSGAAGLFQIMPFWWDAYGGDRFDPETNVALAAVIYSDYGWDAWSAYSKC